MWSGALVVLSTALAGCYITGRGGPARGFDGERRGATVEVLVGAELHFHTDGASGSPVGGAHLAVFNSLGFKHAPAAGAGHAGAIYEIGGSAMVALRQPPSPSGPANVATLLRVDVSGGIGKLAGVEGSTNVGTIVRAMGLVGVEHYGRGWAVRAGGGIALESVVVNEVRPQPQESESSYAPVGALTFDFTPVVTKAMRAVLGR